MREPSFRSILDALDAAGGAAAQAVIDPRDLELARQRLANARRILGAGARESAYLAYAHHLATASSDTPTPFAASA